jgi:hypothetical protein
MDLKAYFFSLDAMLALTLVVTTIVLLSSIDIREPSMTQTNFLSEDLMSVFSELRIGEINNSYVKELIQNGTITQLNNTILEQLGEFYADSNDATAASMFYNITYDILDGENIGLYIEDDQIYSYGDAPREILLTAHRMISGVARAKPVRGYVAKAFLTGLNPLKNYVYYYFGGYVGDGNLTIKLSLPNYSDMREAKFELAVNSSFNLSVNDFNSGSYIHTALPENEAETFYMNPAYFSNFRAGDNYLKFVFDKGGHIGGGFMRIRLNTTYMNYSLNWNGSDSLQTDYLPGIKGVINLYSSMYVPGNLSSLEIFLHYATSDMSVFMTVGNTTIFRSNVSQSVLLTDINLTPLLNYSALSQYTTPIRMGHYSTNLSNYTGNVTDVILTTSRTSSMNTLPPDLPNGTVYNITRIAGAIALDKIFVNVVLNNSGNRVGLVSYKADAPSGSGWDHVLTEDENSLISNINNYGTNPGNKCLCCAIEHSYECLLNSECKNQNLKTDGRRKIIVLMSDGTAEKDCKNKPWSTGDNEQDAIAAACYAYTNYGILVYSVGFGRTADADLLQQIADCGHGKFRKSDNYSGLEEIYKEFAAEIAQASIGFRFQEVIASGVESTLYPDSYIKMIYQPAVPPLAFDRVPITFETRAFNNTASSGSFFLPLNTTLLSALLTSYSGDKWTDNASANGNQFYNLRLWDTNYQRLGDPFIVHIPVNLLNIGVFNTAQVSTGYGIDNAGGSLYDKAIYTLLVQTSASYSGVGSIAKGCNWTLKFEDGSNMSLPIPASYSGTEICDFETGDYNTSDSISTAVYSAFRQLDLDSNGLLDYNLNYDSLGIDTTTISGVPSLWGPSTVEVRTWH